MFRLPNLRSLKVSLASMAVVALAAGWPSPARAAFNIQNGTMDGAPLPDDGYDVAPGWTSYRDATTRVVSWNKELTTVHGPLYSQKITYTNAGAGSFAGIRQTIDAQPGDAITFEAWAWPTTAATSSRTSIRAAWDGSTSRPATWLQGHTTRTGWNKLSGAGNATGTSVTFFMESERTAGSISLTSYFDDAVSFHAFVPPAPSLFAPTANSLGLDVDPGLNSGNGLAEFAITIGGGAFTLGTNWIQPDGSVGGAAAWQTDATWGSSTVTGLDPLTPYTLQVMARYSGGTSANGTDLTLPTALGEGATLTTIPEPAAMLLLALASPIMLRRHRRR